MKPAYKYLFVAYTLALITAITYASVRDLVTVDAVIILFFIILPILVFGMLSYFFNLSDSELEESWTLWLGRAFYGVAIIIGISGLLLVVLKPELMLIAALIPFVQVILFYLFLILMAHIIALFGKK